MALHEILVSFAFIVVNVSVIYVFYAMTPGTEAVAELNSLKLDCLTIANLASANLSTDSSKNLDSSFLDEYDNSYLDFHPKYVVRLEIEELENEGKWIIGELPEEVPIEYEDFTVNFIFPILVDSKLGRLNITCAKTPLSLVTYKIGKYCDQTINFTMDFGSVQKFSLENNFLCVSDGKKTCKLIDCFKAIDLKVEEAQIVNVTIEEKIRIEEIG